MAQSYADKIAAAKMMLSGLKANVNKVSKRGVDAAFLQKLSDTFQNAMTLDNEQEALKSRLKEKTAALDSAMENLGELLSESKKIVKMDLPQESWKEFGISDSR